MELHKTNTELEAQLCIAQKRTVDKDMEISNLTEINTFLVSKIDSNRFHNVNKKSFVFM